jgi:hypothetical protein
MYGNTEHVEVVGLYTREIGDKVEILGKSGKKPQNQRKVIKRVKELYVNKKN